MVQCDRLAVDQTVAAPGSLADPGALGSGSAAEPGPPAKLTVPAVLRWLRRTAGIVPFGAYVTLGLLLPMVAVAIGAFQSSNGGYTFSNVKAATHGVYLHGFEQSIILSVLASILPGIFGLLIAYAIFTAKRGSVLYDDPATAFVAEFVGIMNRIPGELRAGGMVAVLGGTVPVKAPAEASDGDQVDVLVRPEGLTLQVAENGNGIVTTRTFLGSVTRVGVQLSGDIAVQIDKSSSEAAALALGASVSVSLPAQPVLVVPRRPAAA